MISILQRMTVTVVGLGAKEARLMFHNFVSTRWERWAMKVGDDPRGELCAPLGAPGMIYVALGSDSVLRYDTVINNIDINR